MRTYRIRIFISTFFGITSRDTTTESETPMLAAITGLEQLAVCSLEQISGVEICLVSEAEPLVEMERRS